MPDLLVKLYKLPPVSPLIETQKEQGIRITRALSPNKHRVVTWTQTHFGTYWSSEVDVAFSRSPISCFLALDGDKIVGFGCHDTTVKNFFGPTGVLPAYRGRSIGKALLLVCLHAMRDQGYGYAIIGGAGPTGFYEKVVGATVIAGSEPGMYADLLKP